MLRRDVSVQKRQLLRTRSNAPPLRHPGECKVLPFCRVESPNLLHTGYVRLFTGLPGRAASSRRRAGQRIGNPAGSGAAGGGP